MDDLEQPNTAFILEHPGRDSIIELYRIVVGIYVGPKVVLDAARHIDRAPETLARLPTPGDFPAWDSTDMEDCAKDWIRDRIEDGTIPHNPLIHGSKAKRPARLWARFKSQFHLLICTNDRRHSKLRKQMEKTGSQLQIAVTAAIGASIGPRIGVPATAVLVPLGAICLLILAGVGKQVFCDEATASMTLGDAGDLEGTNYRV